MKKKVIKIVIISVLILVVIGGIIAAFVANHFKYNDEDVVGNTAGNLYNGGLFCEYDDYIYFANPNENNQLYRMDEDGDNVKKIHSDKASYINIAGDYIYYVRFNHEDGQQAVFRGNLFGVYRLKMGDTTAVELYGDIANSLALSGNKLFFQSYSDEELIGVKSIGIDGKDLEDISDDDYLPLSVYNEEIYFNNTDYNHNIAKIDVKDYDKSTVKAGNYYMPIAEEGNLYYIDIEAGYQLVKENLSTKSKTVLTDEKCINYNVHSKYGVIYYQVENDEDDHRLMMMDLDGKNETLVTKGDCDRIHITKNYTYYCKTVGIDEIWYYVETGEEPEPKEFQ